MNFPWLQQRKAQTPYELRLERLRQGVPLELVARAEGIPIEELKKDPEVDKALAEGEILLFERARDSGVTGVIRAAMRYETRTWTPKAEADIGLRLEDYLKD